MPTAQVFTTILEHLRDTHKPLPAIDLFHFSNLSKNNLAALEEVWPELPVERRRS